MNTFRRATRTRTRKLVAIAVIIALIGATAALAAWLTQGVGPGAGKTASLAPLTVASSGNAPATLCSPGNGCSLMVSVTNPTSNGSLIIDGFTVPNNTVNSVPECPSSNFTIPGAGTKRLLATPVTIAAGASATIELPNALTLSASAPDGCQGVNYNIVGVTIHAHTP